MRAWSLVCVMLTAACALATGPGLDREVGVRLGEQVTVDDGLLTIGFREVPEDSRCPVDAQCVWAGEAVVVLRLSTAGKAPVDLALRTTPGKNTGSYDGYRVELVDLDPKPRQAGTPPETPRATLRVSRE